MDFKLFLNNELFESDKISINLGFIGDFEYNGKTYHQTKNWSAQNRGINVIFDSEQISGDFYFKFKKITVAPYSFNKKLRRATNDYETIRKKGGKYKYLYAHYIFNIETEEKIENKRLDCSEFIEFIKELNEFIKDKFHKFYVINYQLSPSQNIFDFDGLIKRIDYVNEYKDKFANNDFLKVNVLNDTKSFFCPICNRWIEGSDYLFETFKDNPKVCWLANMVTHYRHGHITSWNKCWGYGGRYYRSGWFGDYDEEKAKVNERAKRQIIRKAKEFLIKHEFKSNEFLKLQNTTKETVDLAIKVLGE